MSDKSRISRVITRGGDQGETGLADGSRLRKDDTRMQAIGDIDELNSHVGLLIAWLQERDAQRSAPLIKDLKWLQHRLFDLGGSLAFPEHSLDCEVFVEKIETTAKALNDQLPPLKEFVLPGPDLLAAQAHVTRTVCRRAERSIVTVLAAINADNNATMNADNRIAFINRVSDYLFILARTLARRSGAEVTWEKNS